MMGVWTGPEANWRTGHHTLPGELPAGRTTERGRMSTSLSVDALSDAELISSVRGGDTEAYGVLFSRHVAAANRLARQLVAPGDADDLVSEAFAKVLVVLQRGGGPDLAFRAYLLTAVRRLHVDKMRAAAKVRPTDDLTPFDPGVPFEDTAVSAFENQAAARAFSSLPERWQLVLWHTEVEGQKPAEIAELLGMSANSVSALAYRAREGLRQAFLTMHAQELDDDACRWANDHLGGYIRQGLSRRDTAKVEKHLDECRSCMAIYLELVEVNSGLAGLLAPLLLGSAGAAYLAGATGAGKGAVVLLLGRVREWSSNNPAVAATGGVAAVAAVIAGVVGAVALSAGPQSPPQAAADTSVAGPTEPGAGDQDADRGDPAPGDRRDVADRDARVPGDAGTPAATTAPTPTDGPTATATDPLPSPTPTTQPSPSHTPTQPSPTGPGPTEPSATEPSSPPTSETTGPTTEPTPTEPTPSETETTPPADLDLRVAATWSRNGANRFTVTGRVWGVTPGSPATLTVGASGITSGINAPAGCEGGGDIVRCTVTQAQSFAFGMTAQERATVVLTVIPGNPADDANLRNNTATVTLIP